MKHANQRAAASGLMALFLLSAVTACNTVKGAGQDIQTGGQAVEGAAKDVQSDMQTQDAQKDKLDSSATSAPVAPSGQPGAN